MNELWYWLIIGVMGFIIWYLMGRQGILQHRNKSQVVKRGLMFEQFVPLLKEFSDLDLERFVFIGKRFDYLIMKDDEIVFLEFKTGSAQTNASEERTKYLVENKKVRWVEKRVN